MLNLKKSQNENEEQYIWRLGNAKDCGEIDMSWDELADIFNAELRDDDIEYTTAAYRKPYQSAKRYYEKVFIPMFEAGHTESDILDAKKREFERAKIQFRDERNAWQKQNYIAARAETVLNRLEEQMRDIGKNVYTYKENPVCINNSDNDLLVLVSDTHIGQEFDSHWGKYNTSIAQKRINKYLDKIIDIQKRHSSENCYISLLGDIISGNIHKSIQVTNSENVISQIKTASEMLASFCCELSKHFHHVYFQSVAGNHTRIEPKDVAMHDERLDDLIAWSIENILSHIPNFIPLHKNLDNGISITDIRGKLYIGCHGDFDPYSKSGISDLIYMTKEIPYAVTMGHYHTCSYSEINQVRLIRGGGLSGAGDQHTIEKRINGEASQMVCVCSHSGIETIYPVKLS